jgi:hypothetical protein
LHESLGFDGVRETAGVKQRGVLADPRFRIYLSVFYRFVDSRSANRLRKFQDASACPKPLLLLCKFSEKSPKSSISH